MPFDARRRGPGLGAPGRLPSSKTLYEAPGAASPGLRGALAPAAAPRLGLGSVVRNPLSLNPDHKRGSARR